MHRCRRPHHDPPPITRYDERLRTHWCHDCGERFAHRLTRDVHVITEHGRAPEPCEEDD